MDNEAYYFICQIKLKERKEIMCGIVGYIGSKDAVNILIKALYKLEYRGYDSAGIAILANNQIKIIKCEGKVERLEKLLEEDPTYGKIGLGHTRWATHGKPCEANAHPHQGCDKRIVVIHNGIIENYMLIKERLTLAGHRFVSETDTEIIPHLIENYYRGDLTRAVQQAQRELEGSYAIAVMSLHEPDKIVATRRGSPLIIGLGEGEMFLASDIPALLAFTKKIIFLEEGEIATITTHQVQFINDRGEIVQKQEVNIDWDEKMAEKDGYKHFMLKEIFQEPMIIRNNLEDRIDKSLNMVELSDLNITTQAIRKLRRIYILACGSSYYTGLAGKYILEEIANIPVEVDYGSEYRYRKILLDKQELVIVISQSGETADTIAALRVCQKEGGKVLAITNVRGSTISREADSVMYIKAGPEIGVATTKAFMGQLICLLLLALYFAQIRSDDDLPGIKQIVSELLKIPQITESILLQNSTIQRLSREFYSYHNFLYLGRGFNYPIALEGALKLKEISYIHAEAYPAGEMKHGPIALLDKNFPVVVLVPQDRVYSKVVNNIKEIKARDTQILAIATQGDQIIKEIVDRVIYIPRCMDILYPLLTIIPLQLFAYYVADLLGCDIDKPRNLAKSVTVE